MGIGLLREEGWAIKDAFSLENAMAYLYVIMGDGCCTWPNKDVCILRSKSSPQVRLDALSISELSVLVAKYNQEHGKVCVCVCVCVSQ